MEATGMYLMKSAAWLTGFALVYLLALRNEHFFRLNRVFLLTGITASLLFPFYTFHYTVVIPSMPVDTASVGDLMIGSVVAGEPPAIPYYYWIYLAGMALFLLRLLFQTWKIYRKLRETGYEKSGAIKLVRTPEFASSFSFFSFVFVNPSIAKLEMEEIMNHEREHIRQRHWFDLLLVELICIVQWFNPFAWIYAHLVRQNHEFLADEVALQRTANPAVYRAALLNQLLGVPVFSLTNSFSYSLNKKRFKMMKKKIDSPVRKFRMLLVLPLVAMLFYAFATPEYQYGSENSSIEPQLKTVDVKGQVVKADGSSLPGTTVILRNSTIGTITDKEGNFELKGMPFDGELVFSFVGLKTIVQKIDNKPMKIVMEVTKVGIDQVTVVGYGTVPPPPPPPPPVDLKKALEGPNPPLVFIDGALSSKEALDQLKPDQIESIDVLKGNSATELYGEKGKNGAILITTKGKADKGTGKKSGNEAVVVSGYRITPAGTTPPPPPPPGVSTVMKGIDAANPPLIFLDGMAISKAEMDKINPSTIQSISILKESAEALYGEKAKNGVILITSKNGPLYFVDGVEMSAKSATRINPSEIASMDVLKGESTYNGIKSSNGIILITTKANAGKGKTAEFTADSVVIRRSDNKVIFQKVEEMPEFPGGFMAMRKFIAETVKYPADAVKDSIQGRVLVSFVVKADGSIGDAKIAKGVYPLLDNEAIRVVNQMPVWKPGKQGGKEVNVAYTVPVLFALNGGKIVEARFPTEPKGPIRNPDGVFVVVEEMPAYPGGELALRKFIAETIKYPEEAIKEGIQGRVFVTFVVRADGSIGDSKLARGVHPLLDKEAIRVVYEMPKWKPGKQGGEAVDVSYTVPIQFTLSGVKNETKTIPNVVADPQKGEKEVFVVVEEMPEFPGGSLALRGFLAKSIRYPVDAQEKKVQGQVMVSFVVSSTGKVENAKVTLSACPALDAEALRVVNLMPDWKPGRQRGQAVSVEYSMPIEFKLQ